MPLRVLVTGGRDFNDMALARRALADLPGDATLVHGQARGADTLAANQWLAWGRQCESWPANWAEHGKAAGPIRNQAMLDSGVDLLIAFPGGRGTADMVRRVQAANIPVTFAADLAFTAGGNVS